MKALFTILILAISLVAFSQSGIENNCFQTFLDDQRFISKIKSSDLMYCDGKLTVIRKPNDTTSRYFIDNNELKYDYDSSTYCSYLSLNVISKRKYGVIFKNPEPNIERVGIGQILSFTFKSKIKDGNCVIKKVKFHKRTYHVRYL